MKNQTENKIIRIDASGQSLGRLASKVAYILSGKSSTHYQPHIAMTQKVEVINASKIKLTGLKLKQKKYYHFSGYPGGLKTTKLSQIMPSRPDYILRLTVMHMLPKNRLRRIKMNNLSINK